MFATEVEALALKEVVQGAILLHLNNVTFESGCRNIVHAIHSNQIGSSKCSLIILSIKSLLFSFLNFEIKFIKHQTNLFIHMLVRAVKF